MREYKKVATDPAIGEPAFEIIFTDNDGRVWVVPQDESNEDYQLYLKSLEK